MRKSIYYLGGSLLVVLFVAAIGSLRLESSQQKQGAELVGKGKLAAVAHAEEEEGGMALRDRVDLAMAQEFRKTVDPALGRVPKERLLLAKAYADELRASN